MATAENVLRGILGVNALLDFALGFLPSTVGTNGLKDGFPGISSDESREVLASGLSVHGFVRLYAALQFESPIARRFAQLSYLGEVVTGVLLRRHAKSLFGSPFVTGPLVLIAALEYYNRNY
jgi:hypothetical protein